MRYDEAIKNCIFRFVSGSHAYGTNTPESDQDWRGVFIAPVRQHFSLFNSSWVGNGSVGDVLRSAIDDLRASKWDSVEEKIRLALSPEHGDLNSAVGTVSCPGRDEELQELRKFLKLASDSNPNIIEFLYVERLIDIETPIWKTIRENRNLFLSKKAKWTFSGYAAAQMSRIRVHRGFLLNPPHGKPTRKEFDLPEETTVPREHQGALLALPDGYVGGGLKDTIRRERAFHKAMDEWRSYEKWARERNPKRKELEAKWGFDLKHAMHLVRLIRMGEEILTTGNLTVYRPDRDELLAIRNGEWSYERIEKYAVDADAAMGALYEKSTLQHAPKHKAISALYEKICQDVYGVRLLDAPKEEA